MQQFGEVNWAHQDPVNKTQRITNSAGQIVAGIERDPWGAETNRSWNDYLQTHRFTTWERDWTGDESLFRRYHGWWSRFAHPDPYDGSYNMSDPQSFNRYAYVQNDPVNFVDPSGLMPGDSCMTGTGQPGIEGNDGRCYAGPSVGVTVTGGGPSPIDDPTTYRFILNSINFRGFVGGPGSRGGTGNPGEQGGSDGAGTIESAVEALMWFIKIGCYPGQSRVNNPDIEPHNKQFAKLNNPEKYTNGWKNVFASHGGKGARESQEFRVGDFDWVLKYYPSDAKSPNAIVVTLPTGTSGHYVAALEYWTINPSVNVQFAAYVLKHIKDCPSGPY